MTLWIGLGLVLLGGFFIWSPAQPRTKLSLLARVEFTPSSVIITNLGNREWVNPSFVLDAKRPVQSIPSVRLAGYHWPAGHRRELPLTTFVGRIDHKSITPPFDEVREVIIAADGFAGAAFQ
jgi:hypothetical protein